MAVWFGYENSYNSVCIRKNETSALQSYSSDEHSLCMHAAAVHYVWRKTYAKG